MEKSADAFRTISEVAADLALPQHVLRFWESRFAQIRPLKRAGGRRYYRPQDVLLLRSIRRLLYEEGYTIKGVQRLMREQGSRQVREEAIEHGLEANAAPELCFGEARSDGELFEPAAASTDDAPIRPPGPGDWFDQERSALRQALAAIEDCERILQKVARTRA